MGGMGAPPPRSPPLALLGTRASRGALRCAALLREPKRAAVGSISSSRQQAGANQTGPGRPPTMQVCPLHSGRLGSARPVPLRVNIDLALRAGSGQAPGRLRAEWTDPGLQSEGRIVFQSFPQPTPRAASTIAGLKSSEAGLCLVMAVFFL